MIKEDYVSFETAKLLKEKGFAEPTCGFYWDDDTGTLFISTPSNHNGSINAVAAPSHGHAMKWLREVHKIEVNIVLQTLHVDGSTEYLFDVFSIDAHRDFDSVQRFDFKSYEQACEEAIKYCLEHLI